MQSEKCADNIKPQAVFCKNYPRQKKYGNTFCKKILHRIFLPVGQSTFFFFLFSFRNISAKQNFLNQNYAYTQSTHLLSASRNAKVGYLHPIKREKRRKTNA